MLFPPTLAGQISDYGQLRPADPRAREGGEGERGDGRREGAGGEEGGQGGGAGAGEGGEDWAWGLLLGHVQELGEVVFVIKIIGYIDELAIVEVFFNHDQKASISL